MIPEPRPAAEQVTPVEMVLVVRCIVPVLGQRTDPAADAAVIIEHEVETFCADYGWEQVSLSANLLAQTEVTP